MTKKNAQKLDSSNISQNRHAWHEYFIEQEFEAGLSLLGWEVKSLRARKVNISDSYVLFRDSEAYLFGATFQPLPIAFSYVVCNSMRTRKLLLNKSELDSLYGFIVRKGYTVVVLSIYWKKAWVKVKIGLAKGKKEYDKRTYIKKREWQLDKERILKHITR